MPKCMCDSKPIYECLSSKYHIKCFKRRILNEKDVITDYCIYSKIFTSKEIDSISTLELANFVYNSTNNKITQITLVNSILSDDINIINWTYKHTGQLDISNISNVCLLANDSDDTILTINHIISSNIIKPLDICLLSDEALNSGYHNVHYHCRYLKKEMNISQYGRYTQKRPCKCYNEETLENILFIGHDTCFMDIFFERDSKEETHNNLSELYSYIIRSESLHSYQMETLFNFLIAQDIQVTKQNVNDMTYYHPLKQHLVNYLRKLITI